MPLAADIINNIVSVSDFSRGKASKILSRVGDDTPIIVLKNNAPMAVITSPAEYTRLTQIEEDYNLICEALDRLERAEESHRYSFDEVMNELELTEEDLNEADEVDFE